MSDLTETLATADDAVLEFIKKDSDAYLGAQLTVALAANQRAMTFFGFLATAATVIAAASVTAVTGRSELVPYGVFGFLTVTGLLAAMLLANLAAMPDEFDYVGTTPADWVKDIESSKPLTRSKAEALADSAGCIGRNRLVLRRSSELTKTAVWVAWGSIGLGVAACALFAGMTAN